jgi:methyl-accepting chemotaxis protein
MKTASVRTMLGGAFALLLVISIAISGFALSALANANMRFEEYIQGVHARANLAAQVRHDIDKRAIAARNLVLVTTPEDMEIEKAIVSTAHRDVALHLEKLKELSRDSSGEDKRLISEMDRVEQAYGPVALNIVELALAKKNDEAIAKMNHDCRPLLAALVKVSDAYAKQAAQQAFEQVQQAENAYTNQRNALLLACGLASLFAMVAGTLITRNLIKSLGAEPHELGALANRVADGDLASTMALNPGDSSSVVASMARMQSSLRQVVASVRENSEQVSTASTQIAQGNQDLSTRTENQASALEETAASMEELNSTVRKNAEAALQANALAINASDIAAKGGTIVNQVVGTMKGINESSRKISDIIGVIDGIAFQTNILALNAAVEAARAGEHGRGFAVVASEVRSLAGRSANAAKEIKALIDASVERVESGTALVDQAGIIMADVVASIQRVTSLMGEISTASAEQSTGVAHVGEAVNHMEKATQQNAALVEEMAAAASSLKAQAYDLVNVVSRFKLGDGHTHRHVTPIKALPR